MKCCWNELSKRTKDWTEIRIIIEDQLTLQRNWNLHPRNPNPDMTGQKDTYWSWEQIHVLKVVGSYPSTGWTFLYIFVVTIVMFA